jgi:hypothetical protein
LRGTFSPQRWRTPRRLETDPRLPAVVAHQDGVLTREQALNLGLTRGAIGHRVSAGLWQSLLPGVLLLQPGGPSRRQLLIVAIRWAGEGALIDGPCACFWHGTTVTTYDPSIVNIIVASDSTLRDQRFVRVRRTRSMPRGVGSDLVTYADLAAALAVTAQRLPERQAAALLAEAVQRRRVGVDDLAEAMAGAPRRGRDQIRRSLDDLHAGIRSVAESDVRRIVAGSATLPEPMRNALLRLPCGRLVSPDALWRSARLVHETNGVRFHAWGADFESMQERHDAMTAAGLVVLHNAPRRLRLAQPAVRAELERCFTAHDGRGLPEGVEIITRPLVRQDVGA